MAPSKKHFQNVLILTDIEVHAQRDRAGVKHLGAESITVCATGSEGIDHLSRRGADLVLCDSQMSDMSALKFLNLVRKNMKLRQLPVVIVSLENDKNYVLDVIAAGCTGYVLRPYSQDTLERHVLLAKQVARYSEIEEIQLAEANDMVKAGDFDDAIEAYEEILSIQDEAQQYYDKGCRYLYQSKYGQAIISFKKAIRINDLFAEAYQGLAEAYKGKGDEDNFKENLKKAAEVHAQFDRLEQTKALFIEILKYETDTPNPYNTMGVRLRRQGDYPGAIHAYGQALQLTPEDEHIHYNMSKAYYFMGNLDEARQAVSHSLSLNPEFAEARQLFKRIAGQEWDESMAVKKFKKGGKEGQSSAMDV